MEGKAKKRREGEEKVHAETNLKRQYEMSQVDVKGSKRVYKAFVHGDVVSD